MRETEMRGREAYRLKRSDLIPDGNYWKVSQLKTEKNDPPRVFDRQGENDPRNPNFEI